jgi:hypothetical protein
MLAFRDGDERAFDALFERWAGRVLRFVERMVRELPDLPPVRRARGALLDLAGNGRERAAPAVRQPPHQRGRRPEWSDSGGRPPVVGGARARARPRRRAAEQREAYGARGGGAPMPRSQARRVGQREGADTAPASRRARRRPRIEAKLSALPMAARPTGPRRRSPAISWPRVAAGGGSGACSARGSKAGFEPRPPLPRCGTPPFWVGCGSGARGRRGSVRAVAL